MFHIGDKNINGDIHTISNAFGVAVTSERPLAGTTLSKAYIVNDTYILRASATDISDQIGLVQQIRSHVSVAFPNFIRTSEDIYVYSFDNMYWTMYPMIPGQATYHWRAIGEVPLPLIQDLCRQMAQMHQGTKGIPLQGQSTYLKDIQKKYRRVQHLCTDEQMSCIDRAIDHVSKDRSQQVYVHGDLHHGNVVLDDIDHICGFIDIDWSRIGHPFEDIAFSAMMYQREYSKSFSFNTQLFEAMITAYGVSDDARALLYAYLLLSVLYDLEVLADTPDQEQEKLVQFQLDMLEYVCSHLYT